MTTKNKLSDLNDLLFAQLNRLAKDDLSPPQLETETKRGAAMVAVASQIISNAGVQLAAAKLVHDVGKGDPTAYLPAAISKDPMSRLPAIEGRPNVNGKQQ